MNPAFEEVCKGQKLEVFFAEPGIWYEGCVSKKDAKSITVEFHDGDEETILSRQMPKKDVRVEAHLCIQASHKRESAEELLQLLRVS